MFDFRAASLSQVLMLICTQCESHAKDMSTTHYFCTFFIGNTPLLKFYVLDESQMYDPLSEIFGTHYIVYRAI